MKKVVAILMALVLMSTIGITAAMAASSPTVNQADLNDAYEAIYGGDSGKKDDDGSDYEEGPYDPYGDGHLLEDVLAAQEQRRADREKAREQAEQDKAAEDAEAAKNGGTIADFRAAIVDSEGNEVMVVYVRSARHPFGELILTPASRRGFAPTSSRDLFQKAYEALQAATDFSKLFPGLGDGYQLIDFFDLTAVGNAARELAKPGNRLKVSFSEPIKAGDGVAAYAMSENGETYDKMAATNNGDGTMGVTFTHLCPVALFVKASTSGVESPKTADYAANIIWALAAVCGLAAVVTLAVSRKRSKAN